MNVCSWGKKINWKKHPKVNEKNTKFMTQAPPPPLAPTLGKPQKSHFFGSASNLVIIIYADADKEDSADEKECSSQGCLANLNQGDGSHWKTHKETRIKESSLPQVLAGNRARLFLASSNWWSIHMVICTSDAEFTQFGLNFTMIEKLLIERKASMVWLGSGQLA